jgi:hypothetical protein
MPDGQLRSHPPQLDPGVPGRLVAWLAAAAAGEPPLAADRVAAELETGTDGHVVLDVASGVEEPLVTALARLLAAPELAVALVLPEPGDPLGLTAIDDFAAAAIDARTGVLLTADGTTAGWVPEVDVRGSSYRGVRWRSIATGNQPVQPGQLPGDADRPLEQADRALRRAMRGAADVLAELDLARWRPESAGARARAQALLDAPIGRLPPRWPAPARLLADRAVALWRVVALAESEGGAASASAGLARHAALRDLSKAVREATALAFNAPAQALLASRYRDAR